MDATKAKEICLIGKGALCCRYLVAGEKGIECVKHHLGFSQMINKRITAGTYKSIGDNCEGEPYMEQPQQN
jgi:hypothetical protein